MSYIRLMLLFTIVIADFSNCLSGGDNILSSDVQPYVFRVAGFSPDIIERVKTTPGVLDVKVEEADSIITFRPWNLDQPWMTPEKWIPKSNETFYQYLPIKRQLGKTLWTHGGPAPLRSSALISNRASICFSFMFDDTSTGHNEIMRLFMFAEAEQDQVFHEMLRDSQGAQQEIVKCGKGNVIVFRATSGVFVVWQINQQMFIRIENSFDTEMVTAYVNKFGSITPGTINKDDALWGKNEITWRLRKLDQLYRNRIASKRGTSALWIEMENIQPLFPSIPKKFQNELSPKCSLESDWKYLNYLHMWFYANLNNIRYDSKLKGYILSGPDLFDPLKPLNLSKEALGPEQPSKEEMESCNSSTQEPTKPKIHFK